MHKDCDHESEKILEMLELLQKGIKLGSERLVKLKANAFFINMFLKEIRDTEQHLINLISRQVIARNKLKNPEFGEPECYIRIEEFLRIVGLSDTGIAVLSKCLSFDTLLNLSDDELNQVISSSLLTQEDMRKLKCSLKSIRLCLENLLSGEKTNNVDLFWNSFDPVHLWSNSLLKPLKSCSQTYRKSESSLCSDLHRRTATGLRAESFNIDSFPSFRNRSATELQVNNDVTNGERCEKFFANSCESLKEAPVLDKQKKSIELFQRLPGQREMLMTNGSVNCSKCRILATANPKKYRFLTLMKKDAMESIKSSSHSPVHAIHHNVPHKWTHTYKFSICNHCNKWIPVVGLRCKECRFKCHIRCEKDVPASCGLSENTLIEYMPQLQKILRDRPCGSSTSCPSRFKNVNRLNNLQIPLVFLSEHSNDNAVRNTSLGKTNTTSASLKNLSNLLVESSQLKREKSIGDVRPEALLTSSNEKRRIEHISTPEPSSAAAHKNDSFAPLLLQLSIDLDEDLSLKRQVTLSTSLKEWDIPIESITIGNKIHTGSYGTVYRARWHGDVALKIITIYPEQDDAETSLRLFKLEVAMMKKLRHENLVLFCGACLKPPNLGIVTSWINGPSLYNKIHVLNEKLPYNLVLTLAHQIVMAMSYLHSRKCLHKDLRTKNIFVEHNSKAIITDYGLSAANRLCKSKIENMITVPRGWLCYLAPEIIKILHPLQVDLSFTEETDVFAFGTVWYEMLFSRIPFHHLPYESLIWQVGSGINQYLASIKTYRSAKDILVKCWKYEPCKRPKFMELCTLLKKLPNKHRSLARSPSTPSQFHSRSNSVESSN